MKLGMLYSILRKDEKLLLQAARKRGVEIDKIDDRQCVFGLKTGTGPEAWDHDVVIERCVSHSRALYAIKFLEDYGIRTINTFQVALNCGDKILSSLSFARAGVPTPRTRIAFEPETAIEAIETLGYPAVLKPVMGSWARLLAKVDCRETAEAIIEHKSVLGNYLHSIYYIQEYVDKPGRDIRAFVVGDETVAAVYRIADHWITNTARGAKTEECKVTDEINELSIKAANSVGGGVIAVDLMESKQGLTITEVNYTMEFKNSIVPTGVDIPMKIIEYAMSEARR
jgi:[lysine-biosynthesis-protein LysW]--L-2-aminoadipate ligase